MHRTIRVYHGPNTVQSLRKYEAGSKEEYADPAGTIEKPIINPTKPSLIDKKEYARWPQTIRPSLGSNSVTKRHKPLVLIELDDVAHHLVVVYGSLAPPIKATLRWKHSQEPTLCHSFTLYFGTLKNIVTAPFTWLATNNEDFAEEKDDQGKRRRVAGSEKTNTIAVGDESRTASDSFGETDEGITRGTKRLRVSSPLVMTDTRSPSGYVACDNDTADRRHRGGSRYSRSSTRASSLALQPTVLVDSPTFGQAQPIQRDVSMSSIPSPREHSMDRKTFGIANRPTRAAPPLGRELSLPPTSRPSFVLRSSLTPQPSQSQLLPLITPSRIRRDTIPISNTIHSLLFPSHGQDLPSQYASNQTVSQAHLTPAQKALHALDVYKTPLIPTRLRAGTPTQGLFDVNGLISGSTSGSTGPDLFRRRNPLILMNDRERGGRRKGDRESSKRDKKHKKMREVNETKPYAGAGGMKKLLARARAEDADELRSAFNEIPKGESRMSTDKAKQKVEVDEEVQTDDNNNVPPLPSSDCKISRNHIARPAAPIGKRPNKFSAVYEDEVMDGDDDTKDAAAFESDDRRKERIELEEAAKRGPAPVQDNDNAEDPPISSLPFSLSKAGSDASASQPAAPPVSVFNTQSEAPPAQRPPLSRSSLLPRLPRHLLPRHMRRTRKASRSNPQRKQRKRSQTRANQAFRTFSRLHPFCRSLQLQPHKLLLRIAFGRTVYFKARSCTCNANILVLACTRILFQQARRQSSILFFRQT
ncbi:Mitochondrial escape protein [Salix suchowensis]|nr:Mitochondrial escape protein [Salix suchowensis]